MPGQRQAQYRARRHNGRAHPHGRAVELLDTVILPCAGVVANDGTQALHNAVGGQIQESLQFVVDAQHHNIALGERRQQSIQEGDKHRRQRQIQDSRHANGVQLQVQLGVGPQAGAAQLDRDGPHVINDEVEHDRYQLADAGSQRRACNAHFREGTDAENQQRVKDDVADGAAHQADHCDVHPANGLKNLLKRHGRHDDNGKHKGDAGIGQTHGDDRFIAGEGPQKARHDGRADDGDNDAVNQRKHHAVGGGSVSLFLIACAHVQRDQRTDADAETNRDCIDEVLHRVHQRERGHGFLTDAGNEEAVHNVVQRVDQHGNDHGQRHRSQQRENRFFFHKGIVHGFLLFGTQKCHTTARRAIVWRKVVSKL